MANQSWSATLKNTFKDFMRDKAPMRAAALSYYTAFALPPLLILITMIAGAVWSPDQVARALEQQFSGMIGAEGASTVRNMVASGERSNGTLGTVLGFAGLIFGATGALISLQDALNAVWNVKVDPKSGGIKGFLLKRLLSLGMILGLGFLLVVSLAASAALAALSSMIGNEGVVMQVIGTGVSLAILSFIFAAIYKYLPDADVTWGDVWIGGVVTAVLLEVGKLALGLYLGAKTPGTAFGAASALAVILVWIYYSAMLVLLGAEFTQQYAARRGHVIGVRPGDAPRENQGALTK
jgi:membrane protein